MSEINRVQGHLEFGAHKFFNYLGILLSLILTFDLCISYLVSYAFKFLIDSGLWRIFFC